MSPVTTCWPTFLSQPCSHIPVIWSMECFKFPSLSEVSMFKSSEISVERRKRKPPQWITQYWSGHTVGTNQPLNPCDLNSGCLHVSLGSPGNPAHSGEVDCCYSQGHTIVTTWLLGLLQLKHEEWFLLLLPVIHFRTHVSLALPPRNVSDLKGNWKDGPAWKCPALAKNSAAVSFLFDCLTIVLIKS